MIIIVKSIKYYFSREIKKFTLLTILLTSNTPFHPEMDDIFILIHLYYTSTIKCSHNSLSSSNHERIMKTYSEIQ